MQHSPGSAVGNGDLFKNVDKQLQKADFIRPPQQIRIWCKCLKKMLLPGKKKKNSKSGNNPVACPFGNPLEELLGPRPLSQVHHGVDIGF